MKYNERSINKFYTTGKNALSRTRRSVAEIGKNFTPKDGRNEPSNMLDLIERLKALTSDHYGSANKSYYAKRFEREREACLEDLWAMYGHMQSYINHGAFSEGGQAGMKSFTPRLEEHLINSNSEPQKNGTFYREKLNRKTPITEGPLARVKGMVCELYGPRWESPKTFKMCSKVDTVNGGRSVMAIGSGMSFPAGTTFETYTVKLFPVVSETFIDALGTPITVTDPNWVRSVSRIGEGREHTVRVPIYNY